MATSPTPLTRLYEEAGPLVLRRCTRMLRDPHEAMDVTQWTFVRALETGFEVRSRGEALAWLYRTATQRCLWLMRNRRHRAHLRVVHHASLEGLKPASPEAAVADREILDRVLDEVDDRTAEIALLTWGMGMTNDRAAEICGVSVRTVGRARSDIEARVRALTEEAG